LMEDYRPYLPTHLRAEFDEFLKLYREHGRRSFDKQTLSARLDPPVVDQWMGEVFDRLDGNHDPDRTCFGRSMVVDPWGTVLAQVADGVGIAAQVPYLQKLIHGYNTREGFTRRVHLIWQVSDIGACNRK